VTHVKQQKLSLSTQVRGNNTQIIITTAPEMMKLIFVLECVANDGPYTPL